MQTAKKTLLTQEEILNQNSNKKLYMGTKQLDFFKQKLMDMKKEHIERKKNLKNDIYNTSEEPDDLDKAIIENSNSYSLRFLEREDNLLQKIEESILRIENKTYGYCEDTDNPIGIKRLISRPTTTLCIEAKKLREYKEKTNQE